MHGLMNIKSFYVYWSILNVSLPLLLEQSQTLWVVYHLVPPFIYGLVNLKYHSFLYFETFNQTKRLSCVKYFVL